MSSSEKRQKRVAVVGGGIAGLTAAFTIRQRCPDAQIDLLEASSRFGGAIETEQAGGILVEWGADMFATEPAAGLELCKELGIEDELITPLPGARGAAIVQNGKLIRIPEGFVLMRPTLIWPMLRTPLLSLAGKLRLLAEPFVAKRGEIADESIESFVTRRFGRETLDRIVQPLVGGIYTGDVAKLSMAATMAQFWEMEQRDGSLYRATTRRRREGADSAEQNSAGARYEKFRSVPTGMGRFAEELTKRLDRRHLHLNARVQSLVKSGEGWKLTWTTGDDGSVVDSAFSHIIVATPARIAAKLLADVVPEASRELEAIRFASSAVVVFGVREADIEQQLAIAGFIVPIEQRRKIIAVSFTGDKFAGRTPQGYKLLRVFIGGELQPELLSLSDSQLVDMAKDELKELIGLRGEPVLTKVVRWNDAMPQYHVGHLQRLKVIQAAVGQHRGLSLIGNSLHGVGIAPTIAYARKVAMAVAAE